MLTDKCSKILDEALTCLDSNSKMSKEADDHISSCCECRRSLEAVKSLRASVESVLPAEDNENLRIRLSNSLEAAMEKRRASSVVTAKEVKVSFFDRLNWYFLSFAAVTAIAVLLVWQFIGNSNPATIKQNHSVMLSQIPENTLNSDGQYLISIDGLPEKSISLDEPVTLKQGQRAKITLCDGSVILAQNATQLNVQPRGFHLLKGKISVKAAKCPSTFKGTTPHGTITVLGTEFTCETNNDKTAVAVQSGSVSVNSNDGNYQILNPGQKAEMLSLTHKESQKIPCPFSD